jgi:hypothetical protein
LREIMAQKDARIHFLERELAEREKEMQMMKEREQLPVAGVDDERLRELERKVRELDALVKGLTEEVLDVKSVVMKLARETDERRERRPVQPAAAKPAQELRAEPRTVEPRSQIRPAEKRPSRQVTGEKAPDERDFEMIMQNDGTLKPEPKRPSSEYIIASTGTKDLPPKSVKKGGKSSDRKVFVEQRKRPVNDLIQAEEDDTVDLDRR